MFCICAASNSLRAAAYQRLFRIAHSDRLQVCRVSFCDLIRFSLLFRSFLGDHERPDFHRETQCFVFSLCSLHLDIRPSLSAFLVLVAVAGSVVDFYRLPHVGIREVAVIKSGEIAPALECVAVSQSFGIVPTRRSFLWACVCSVRKVPFAIRLSRGGKRVWLSNAVENAV